MPNECRPRSLPLHIPHLLPQCSATLHRLLATDEFPKLQLPSQPETRLTELCLVFCIDPGFRITAQGACAAMQCCSACRSTLQQDASSRVLLVSTHRVLPLASMSNLAQTLAPPASAIKSLSPCQCKERKHVSAQGDKGCRHIGLHMHAIVAQPSRQRRCGLGSHRNSLAARPARTETTSQSTRGCGQHTDHAQCRVDCGRKTLIS